MQLIRFGNGRLVCNSVATCPLGAPMQRRTATRAGRGWRQAATAAHSLHGRDRRRDGGARATRRRELGRTPSGGEHTSVGALEGIPARRRRAGVGRDAGVGRARPARPPVHASRRRRPLARPVAEHRRSSSAALPCCWSARRGWRSSCSAGRRVAGIAQWPRRSRAVALRRGSPRSLRCRISRPSRPTCCSSPGAAAGAIACVERMGLAAVARRGDL